VLNSLLEKGLIKILGRKEVAGRPLVYGSSRRFLEVFGLRNLSGLPTLQELDALRGKEGVELQEGEVKGEEQ
jgi:segregation and condensation protein B